MKVPVKWLKDYVDFDINPNELADKLTLSGSKVEEVITAGDEIVNVVTAKIESIEQHPDAEKLVICQVNVGKEELVQIVTGAKNMKEGDIVPAALHGAILADGLKIKKGKLRGVVSNGMMCSEEELGIATDEPVHGLMILPEDTKIGIDIKDALGLNKAIIDFEITSNRPDCLSVVGIARETAATLKTSYKMPEMKYTASSNERIEDLIKVDVKDDLCKRYMARGVKNVKVAPSPLWMQEYLIDAGIRPINNIVDITNFVMLEIGQPMHAFDKREISTNNIVIERAKDAEKFTTLDEVERTLTSEVLTIKDKEKTIALAGIMGGLNSEIKDDTTDVIFESANFEGTNIRVNSKELSLRTESSSRFEKEIDPNLAELAINRACYLVELLECGNVMEGTIDIYNDVKKESNLLVNSNWVNNFLGTDLSKDEMKRCLDSLDLKTEIEDENLNIKVPTFRIDINIKEDIAEEIARIYGYDNIPATISKAIGLKGSKSEKIKNDDLVVETMLSLGLNQSISYSFVSPKSFDNVNMPKDSELRNAIAIKNPLGEDYSLMRTSTIASMMESLARNYSRNNEEARLFEIGKVYISKGESVLPEERNILTVGLYGNVDYLDIKGIIEETIESFGINNSIFKRQSENTSFHPGKTADLYVNKDLIGILGEIHPDVCENYGIDVPCFIAEINLDMVYKKANTVKKYKPIPKFPAVTRDIAVLVDAEILVQEIEESIRKAGGHLVEKVKLFDVYKGKQIPEGKKSVAYAIFYRDENKTLTDKEVNKVHDKILKALEYKLGAELR